MVPESVAEKVGVTPPTPLLEASLRVMVTVEVATPLAITGPLPVMVEVAAATALALMTNDELSTDRAAVPPLPERSALAAVKTLVPVASMDNPKPAKSATPATAAIETVPDSVPVEPAFRLKLIVAVESVPVETTLPEASLIRMTGCGERATLLVELTGSVLKTTWVAAPWVKETVEPTLEMGEVMVKVLVSAVELDKLQVETPEAFVTEHRP